MQTAFNKMKSIIVIDTPSTCSECMFNQIYNSSNICCDLTVCTAVKNRLFILQDDKPKWCPLKQMPDEAAKTLLNGLDAFEKMKSVEVKTIRKTECTTQKKDT